MASKPAVVDVRVIIATALTDPQVQAMIDDAALIADQCAAVATYSAAQQMSIVKWITAHLINGMAGASGGGQLKSKTLGDASESYVDGGSNTNLKGSAYGQRAILLDPSGCLERLGKSRARVQVL